MCEINVAVLRFKVKLNFFCNSTILAVFCVIVVNCNAGGCYSVIDISPGFVWL